MKISIVIPALNEEEGIGEVINQIPKKKLKAMGYQLEIIVANNGSTDGTAQVAADNGAKVIFEPLRGYGNAYKAGFTAAEGDIIITGDADMTYPFDALPELLNNFTEKETDFLNTNRLAKLKPGSMHQSHVWGNRAFSLIVQALFGSPFKDSQSGMWIFKRSIWECLDVRSQGMSFSQEIKIEAYMKGFKCDEVPVEFRARIGKVKLRTINDGFKNLAQLIYKRLTIKKSTNTD